MDPLVKKFYLCFYSKKQSYVYSIARLIEHNDAALIFIKKYSIRGSGVYHKYLEHKSKEAREVWGKQIMSGRRYGNRE